MLDAAQYFAAGLHHDISRVLFQILTEGIVRRQEEPGVEPGLDGSEPGDVGLREGVIGIMHGVGTARLVLRRIEAGPLKITILLRALAISPAASAVADAATS